MIVEPDVTYHSSQNMTDQFIVENVSKIINHKNVVIQGLAEMIEVLDTIEIQEVQVLGLAEMIEALDLIEVQKIIDSEKCTK